MGDRALVRVASRHPKDRARGEGTNDVDRLILRLTGRAKGTSRPSSRSTIANSSDSNRQPNNASAAVNVLLPAPGSPGSITVRP